ncbi:MAG: ATP-binding cassette domain-containing protein [Bifidobacterium sp.]|uniref:ATP-binding cassette domain-containing protein n=2 Tax=Bifidobacterium TaxID=1678 RepID=A0AB39UIS9_9BIFI
MADHLHEGSDPSVPLNSMSSNAEHRRAVLENPIVLRVRDIEKSFQGLRAVDKLSFDLHKGEVISIIGPNGSGKSTTINLISGFIAPDAGLIDIENNPVAGLSAAEVSDRGLARTFQNGRVFAGLTVDENIGLGYHKKLRAQRPFSGLQRFPILKWLPLLAETGVALIPGPHVRRERREVEQRIGREIDRFRERLESRRSDYAYTLSYANRRRTEIARAHISEPTLLLLDEPTAGMNQSETAEVLRQLQFLKDQGHTILLVEHKIELVTALSDRVLAMDGGRIIAQGDPDEVRSNPQVVEAYLGKRRPSAKRKIDDSRAVLSMQNALERQPEDALNAAAGMPGGEADRQNGNPVIDGAEAPSHAGNAEEALLSIRAIDVFYGQVHALQSISVDVPHRAIVSLLGGNASGKSTTMKSILGLERTRRGQILYDGVDITSASTRRRVMSGIGAVPEARRVFPQMSVQENLLAGAYTRKGKGEIRDDLDDMYMRFPRLKERRNQQAGTLSGGEQQMLAFARALMSHPRLICMDEPTMGLSPKLVEDVLEQIVKLRDDLGISVLMVEQQAELALSIADYGYVLQNGSIRLQGPASSLLDNPQVQEAYLGGAREGA